MAVRFHALITPAREFQSERSSVSSKTTLERGATT
jgi:hypothetical protein